LPRFGASIRMVMVVNLMRGRRRGHKDVTSSCCTEGLNQNTLEILLRIWESVYPDPICQSPPSVVHWVGPDPPNNPR